RRSGKRRSDPGRRLRPLAATPARRAHPPGRTSPMKPWQTCSLAVVLLAGAAWLAAVPAADPPPAAPEGTLVVLDGAGKEQKRKAWKLVLGPRPLGWLAPAPKEGDDKKPAPAGPEALEFRDENSTTFQEGISTLIPLDRIRAIDYGDVDDVSV